jgi:hypothetical protein
MNGSRISRSTTQFSQLESDLGNLFHAAPPSSYRFAQSGEAIVMNRIQLIESAVTHRRNSAQSKRPAATRAHNRAVPFWGIPVWTWTDTALTSTNLAQRFGSGISLALFQDDPELERRAKDWAVSEDAIGPKGTTKIDSTKLVFGRPLNGDRGLDKIAADMAAALQKVAGVTSAQPHTMIRLLALFTHGTNDWIGIGGSISGSKIAGVVKKMAPHLTNDVKVVLFGCSSARGTAEEDAWVTSTLNDGGADSLCGTIRDALLAENLTLATVWGHTGVGHTTTNWTLREFRAADGKGSNGRSFVKAYGIPWDTTVVDDLRTKMKDAKWTIDASNDAEFVKRAKEAIQSWELRKEGPYGAWAKVNDKEKLGDRNLSEAAPTNPTEVGAILAKEWTTHFEANWEAIAKVVGKKAKLSQTKSMSLGMGRHVALSIEHPWSHSFPFVAGDAFSVELGGGITRAIGSGAVSSADETRLGVTLSLRDGPLRSIVLEATHVADGPKNRLRALVDGTPMFDADVAMQSAGNAREITPSNFSIGGMPIDRLTLSRVDADSARLCITSAGVALEVRLSRKTSA